MTQDLDDLIGDAPTKPKRVYSRRVSGELHTLLSKALPDLCSEGVCNLHKLAAALDITYQGVHKWVRPNQPNRIPAKQVERIVGLSKLQKTGGQKFKPVEKVAFLPFMF